MLRWFRSVRSRAPRGRRRFNRLLRIDELENRRLLCDSIFDCAGEFDDFEYQLESSEHSREDNDDIVESFQTQFSHLTLANAFRFEQHDDEWEDEESEWDDDRAESERYVASYEDDRYEEDSANNDDEESVDNTYSPFAPVISAPVFSAPTPSTSATLISSPPISSDSPPERQGDDLFEDRLNVNIDQDESRDLSDLADPVGQALTASSAGSQKTAEVRTEEDDAPAASGSSAADETAAVIVTATGEPNDAEVNHSDERDSETNSDSPPTNTTNNPPTAPSVNEAQAPDTAEQSQTTDTLDSNEFPGQSRNSRQQNVNTKDLELYEQIDGITSTSADGDRLSRNQFFDSLAAGPSSRESVGLRGVFAPNLDAFESALRNLLAEPRELARGLSNWANLPDQFYWMLGAAAVLTAAEVIRRQRARALAVTESVEIDNAIASLRLYPELMGLPPVEKS